MIALYHSAVSRQVPFILYEPRADISKALANLASRYENHSFNDDCSLPKSNFIQNMKKYFFGR